MSFRVSHNYETGLFATLLACFVSRGCLFRRGEDRLVEKPIINVGASLILIRRRPSQELSQSLSDELDGAQQIDIDFMRGEVVDNAYSQSADPWAFMTSLGKNRERSVI
jgi:hypothetical protein